MGEPFAFGVCDCTLLAIGALDAQLGTGLLREHEGAWHSRRSAYAYSRRSGFTFEQYVAEKLLAEPIARGFEAFGDFLMVEQEIEARRLWKRPVICVGGGTGVTVAEDIGCVARIPTAPLPPYHVLRLR